VVQIVLRRLSGLWAGNETVITRSMTMADIMITITCPVCEKEFKKKAKDLADGTVVKCPGCGEQTTIKGTMFTDLVKNLEKQ